MTRKEPNILVSNSDEKTVRCQLIPGGFAGTGPNGSFFEAPEWVDKSKAPGMTSQEKVTAPPGWWIPMATGKFLFFSPNFVWLCIALTDYFFFPYDFQAAKSLQKLDWVLYRFFVNFAITFGFFGFWHCVLYGFGWSERPFHPNRRYKLNKVIHNMWYSFLGVVQFTIWEAIFLHCCATNRIPFLSDEQAFHSSPWNLTMFCLAAFWVPLYREFHFYFAHRFIHIKALYKYIHSLHHRNSDIEPFAGLCMHPIEHLYYYSCVGPSLILFASPFAFMWNGVHLLISPAASHSGWEDHFQSDQYHYLHHRFFECNYGTSGTPFDKIFGTFRDKLKETGTSYRGGSEEKVDDKTAAIHDAKASLAGRPDPGFVIYIGLNCAIWALLWFSIQKQFGIHEWNPHYLAFLASSGPVIIAQMMANITENSKLKRSIFYPFHKDGWRTMSMHLVISTLVCVGPVYILVHMLLSNPGDSFYYWIRS